MPPECHALPRRIYVQSQNYPSKLARIVLREYVQSINDLNLAFDWAETQTVEDIADAERTSLSTLSESGNTWHRVQASHRAHQAGCMLGAEGDTPLL